MSLLDIDERILELIELVDFDKSPIDDIKSSRAPSTSGSSRAGWPTRRTSRCCARFRKHCNVLVAVGECALTGGVPAMRNLVPLKECLEEAYLNGPTVVDGVDSRTTPTSRCCSTGCIPATRW